jgi:DNA repair photolyase
MSDPPPHVSISISNPDPAASRVFRGRGFSRNPPNRFQLLDYVQEPESLEEEPSSLRTRFFRDASRRVISTNDSPDVGFDKSLNPYRGCEHGCVYCYARPTHEYLGLSAGLDFETQIFVKGDAPELLRQELSSPGWKPQTIAISGVTDAYQPAERGLKVTRRCLEVLTEFRNPSTIVTKNHLVTRDIDLLQELARHRAVAVTLSIATLDDDLRRRLEPRTSSPKRRLEALGALSEAGIPSAVMVAPVIPGLTEPEIPEILDRAARAGATHARYLVLRLPHTLAEIFAEWLQVNYPGRRSKILHRIQALRGGRLNDPRFGARMRGEGVFAREIEALFALGCRRAGLSRKTIPLSATAFRHPVGDQLSLFPA